MPGRHALGNVTDGRRAQDERLNFCIAPPVAGMHLAFCVDSKRRAGRRSPPRADPRRAVGLRTFSDADGNSWRVWRVETPTASAHLVDSSFRGGWLAFERESGQERRRLAHVPEDWESLPPERLVALLDAAIRVDLSRTGVTSQRSATPPPEREP
jgi:hypothetical protein